MNIAQIEEAVRRGVPFKRKLADGDEHRVPHRDYIFLPPRSIHSLRTNPLGGFATIGRSECAGSGWSKALKARTARHEYDAQKNKCPECGGITLYKTTAQAAGGHGPAFLPGLGGFLRFAKFEIIACASCGLTRFYAEPSACDKLPRARRWQRL